jgi:DNA polymerase-3 subunit delta
VKFSQINAFQKHLTDSAPNHFASVYALLMKDPIDRGWILDSMKERLLEGRQREWVSISADEGLEKLFFEHASLSLIATPKVIHCPLELIGKPQQERLCRILKEIQPSWCFLFSGDALTKSSALYKAIETEGVILELPAEKPWEREKGLSEWLLHQAAKDKVQIASDAVQRLVKGVNGSYRLLAGEWESLLLYTMGRKAITSADVDAVCQLTPPENSWAFGDAILLRDSRKALEAALQSIDQGTATIALLRQVRHQLMTVLKTALHHESGTMDAWLEKTPYLRGALAEKQLRSAHNYGKEALLKAIHAIDSYELKAKDGLDQPELLVTQLIAEIT